MNRILSCLVFAYRGAIGALAAGRRLGSENRGLRMEDSLLPAVLCFDHLSSILHPRCRQGSARVSSRACGSNNVPPSPIFLPLRVCAHALPNSMPDFRPFVFSGAKRVSAKPD